MEFIGFIISILAMVFLLMRNAKEMKKQRDPEVYKKEKRVKDKQLKNLLRTLNVNLDDEDDDEEFTEKKARKERYVSNNKSSGNYAQTTKLQHAPIMPVMPVISTPNTAAVRIENAAPMLRASQKNVARIVLTKPSRGNVLLKSFKSKKDMIIIRELISPPKSAQTTSFHEYWG